MPVWTGTRAYEIESGQLVGVHCTPEACDLNYCPIHAPSHHRLANAPRRWDPVMGVMSRVCEHEKMHPDPDDDPQQRLCFCSCRCCEWRR